MYYLLAIFYHFRVRRAHGPARNAAFARAGRNPPNDLVHRRRTHFNTERTGGGANSHPRERSDGDGGRFTLLVRSRPTARPNSRNPHVPPASKYKSHTRLHTHTHTHARISTTYTRSKYANAHVHPHVVYVVRAHVYSRCIRVHTNKRLHLGTRSPVRIRMFYRVSRGGAVGHLKLGGVIFICYILYGIIDLFF